MRERGKKENCKSRNILTEGQRNKEMRDEAWIANPVRWTDASRRNGQGLGLEVKGVKRRKGEGKGDPAFRVPGSGTAMEWVKKRRRRRRWA